MSWLMVGGLSVTCMQCSRRQDIARKGGPDYMQVGDQNVMEQTALRQQRGEENANLYYLRDWCADCVKELLTTPEQQLFREKNELYESMIIWIETFRRDCREKLQSEIMATLDGMDVMSWLTRYFPDSMRHYSTSPLFKQDGYFKSWKKSFRKSVVYSINNSDILMPDGFTAWLEQNYAQHPFTEEIDRFEARVKNHLVNAEAPWVVVEETDLQGGISLNPYLSYNLTTFVAEEGEQAILYYPFEMDPQNLVDECQALLSYPNRDWWAFLKDQRFLDELSDRLRKMCNDLTLPAPQAEG